MNDAFAMLVTSTRPLKTIYMPECPCCHNFHQFRVDSRKVDTTNLYPQGVVKECPTKGCLLNVMVRAGATRSARRNWHR